MACIEVLQSVTLIGMACRRKLFDDEIIGYEVGTLHLQDLRHLLLAGFSQASYALEGHAPSTSHCP